MAKKNNTYSLRADVAIATEKTIKKQRARLTLLNKPDNLADTIDFICAEFEKTVKK